MRNTGSSSRPIVGSPSQRSSSAGHSHFSSSFRSGSPLAQESIARDLAASSGDDDAASIDSCEDGQGSDYESEASTLRPSHQMSGSYRRPSFFAFGGGNRPAMAPQHPEIDHLSKREIAQATREEESLLRDNHLAPPKHPRAKDEALPSRLYRSIFSTKVPRPSDEEETPNFPVQPTETSPLLANGVPESAREIQERTNRLWEQAVREGKIETTWQREAKTLAKYSTPLIITFLLQYSLTVASIFTVGHIGKIELGAVSLASMTANITGYAIFQGLATSLDTLCAQAYGSGRKHLVGLQCQRMILFLWTLSIPVGIFFIFSNRVLEAIVPEKESADLAGLYLRVLVFGLPGYALFESGKRFVQAQGLFSATTYVLLIAAPTNAFMNWLFVWRFEWGYVGAPIAVVVTHNLLPILLFLYVYFIDGHQCWHGFSYRALSNWGPMIKLAIPGLVMVEAEFLAFEVLVLASSYFGTTHLAAQSVLGTISAITFQIPFPLSIAASTRVANLIGATLSGAARTSAKVAVYGAVLVGLFNVTILWTLRHHIPQLFTNDPEVIELVARVLPLCAAFQLFDALAALSNGLLRGLGRQEIGGYLNLFCYYVVALPISFGTGFGLDWKLEGLWGGVAIGLGLVAAGEGFFLVTTDWEHAVEAAAHRNAILVGLDGAEAMAHVLPSNKRGGVKRQKLSAMGAAMKAPRAPKRASLTATAVKAFSTLKSFSSRRERSDIEGVPYRMKCEKVSAPNDTGVGRPQQLSPVNQGLNNDTKCGKSISEGGGRTVHYPLSACEDSKSIQSTLPSTRPVTPPQPALEVSHLNHSSVTKSTEPTPDQLLASKSFKDLSTSHTQILCRIDEENATTRRPVREEDPLLRDSAISLSLSDVLRRPDHPPSATIGGGVVEGLIDDQDKRISKLHAWDVTDDQLATAADKKGHSSEGPTTLSDIVQDLDSKVLLSAPECLQAPPTAVRSVVAAAGGQALQNSEESSAQGHEQMNDSGTKAADNDKNGACSIVERPPLELNSCKYPQISTLTQPPSDTPESGNSQSAGGESFMGLVYGPTASFNGKYPSTNAGKPSRKRQQKPLVKGSTKNSEQKFSPLCLRCWYDAMGNPCLNGKGYGSPDVRHLKGDHFNSKNIANNHILFEECPICDRSFAYEDSWNEHLEQLNSNLFCLELSAAELNALNYEASRKGIPAAQMEKVDQAILQYKKDQSLPGVYTEEDKHWNKHWINTNAMLYIVNSGKTESEAQKELGMWLAGLYAIFPGRKPPSNPFTKNNAVSLVQQGVPGLLREALAQHPRFRSFHDLNDEDYLALTQVFGNVMSNLELQQQIEGKRSPETKRQPPEAKRPRLESHGAPQIQTEYLFDPELLQPSPSVGFGESTTLYNDSSFSSGHTDATSYNEAYVDPRMIEKDGQATAKLGHDPQNLSKTGTQFDGDVYGNTYPTTLEGNLGQLQHFNQTHQSNYGH
ncbi:hypothetical protein V494_04709 [Pseudogymnoascus sp. VKM F-4513 (FW-928)]|nr:hypothetical protein V494_04709 [Pseudogymnoascus sp. VKM F-4513 (FW-928)]